MLKKTEINEEDFKVLYKDNIFREALYLASPELCTQIERWQKGEVTKTEKTESLKHSIIKYAVRMSTRCTPFGLFAGCGVGQFHNKTNILLEKITACNRSTRLDYTVLNTLQKEVLKDTAINAKFKYYPNNSLYQVHDHYRYIKYCIKDNKRDYSLDGVMVTDYLKKSIESSYQGKTVNELATLLVDDDISYDDATVFMEELKENQILVSEIEMTVTGPNYLHTLINRIQSIDKNNQIVKSLIDINQKLKKLDDSFGNTINDYIAIKNNVKQLLPNVTSKHLFQTDTFTNPKQNTIDWKLKYQLKRVFMFFNTITLPSANTNMVEFKKEFFKRFETAEIPLALALDVETGIGYAKRNEDSDELLEDFIFNYPKKRYKKINWSDFDDIMLEKYSKALSSHAYTIMLADDDITDIGTTHKGKMLSYLDLPETMSAMLEVYSSKIFIDSIGGSSAINLLGRFGSGEEALYKHILEIQEIEEKLNPNSIIAEIVHLPEARTGNILHRPNIRTYEIPYLAESSLHKDKHIPISDILVSIKNDKIVLRSKKLNKEIIPRLDNAHNYSHNPLPIYHFLCDLQSQNKRSWIGFSWSSLLEQQEFLPRVEYMNFILSKARWRIRTKDFKLLFEGNCLLKNIKTWQNKLKLPDYVELTVGDNKLCINLKNKTMLKVLYSSVKQSKWFILEEFLPSSENTIVKDVEGNLFCNQVVVAFYNSSHVDSIK